MSAKTKLRIVQILCVISLIATGFSIQDTYARYFEQKDTKYISHIKRWVINVNTYNIHENETLSEVMTPVLPVDGNINNNILVPGRTGYFPFEINYSNVDLSFQFQFEFEQLNTTQLTDFEIYGFQIIDGANTTTIDNIGSPTDVKAIINPVTNTIILSNPPEGFNGNLDSDKKVEIRALFRWNDENKDTVDENDAEGMNNFEDTDFVGEDNGEDLNKLLKYNVKISFTQYVGE